MTLSVDEFLQKFTADVGSLNSHAHPISMEHQLVEDLSFDSFQMLLVLDFLSDLLGYDIEIGDHEFVEMTKSVRSLYDTYLTKASSPLAVSKSNGIGSAQGPEMEGHLSRLRPMDPQDYRRLFSLAVADGTAWRWRFSGVLPSYEEWLKTLNTGVHSQLVIVDRSDDIVGLVVAYNASLNNGHVYVAAMVEDELCGGGMGAEAVRLFLRYVFTTWNFDKVYFEVPEFNLEQFRSAIGHTCVEEACLRGHLRYQLRKWNLSILAVYRDRFAELWMKDSLGRPSGAIMEGSQQGGG